MIHVYALSYKVEKYVRLSLDSMLENSSEKTCITVIDNKSESSDKIFKYVKPLIDSGHVKRFIQLKDNVQIMAFNQAYQMYPPDGSEEFFMFTELDLIVRNFDWIKETRIMMQEGHVLSGFRLSLENYGPPHGGHMDDGISCGFWLMALNTKVFNGSVSLHHSLSDHRVREFMKRRGTMKQNKNCLYHLAWNVHKDDPEYFCKKVDLARGKERWNLTERSPVEFVYERP